jgi:hypothetical protein
MPGQFGKCSRFRLPDVNDQIAAQQRTPFEEEKRKSESERLQFCGLII